MPAVPKAVALSPITTASLSAEMTWLKREKIATVIAHPIAMMESSVPPILLVETRMTVPQSVYFLRLLLVKIPTDAAPLGAITTTITTAALLAEMGLSKLTSFATVIAPPLAVTRIVAPQTPSTVPRILAMLFAAISIS